MPFAEKNGIRIAYEERGSGAPFVLVSGIGMQLVSWPDELLDGLASRGLRVITLDNRDVGLSTQLREAGVPPMRKLLARAMAKLPVQVPYTLYEMAGDVAMLLDTLGVARAHVGGVSLGGMVAQAFAIRHGDRLASLTSIMSHSGGRSLTGRPAAVGRLVKGPPRSREEAIQLQLEFFRAAGSTRFTRDETALGHRIGLAYDRSFHPAGFARQLAAVLGTGDMRPGLSGVRAKTLVLHGTDDGIFDVDCGRATAKAIPGAELVVIDGWGHDLAEGVIPTVCDLVAAHVHASA